MSDKIKVIFLDIDGVLNNPKSGFGGFVHGNQIEYYHEQIKWDQDCVDQLRMLCKDTGAKIVVSSYWRKDFDEIDFWKMFGIYGWRDAIIIDRTKELDAVSGPYDRYVSASPRAVEVCEWLERNQDRVESFVVLDDMSEINFYQLSKYDQLGTYEVIGDRYIRTDENVGFTVEDAKRALEQLNTPWINKSPLGRAGVAG